MESGGGATDATDDTAVLAVVAALQTPLICAVGHEADENFIKRLADKTIITPTALGTYFRDMIECMDKVVSQSEAAMRDRIKKEYEKRLAEANKQNEEINKRLAEASKQVAKLTKLQAETTKHTQQMNLQLAPCSLLFLFPSSCGLFLQNRKSHGDFHETDYFGD